MTDLVVRRLLIDLEQPVARHWCGNDAFQTAFFNALSMSFPVGEQFFIDAVRGALATLPEEQKSRWETEVRGFIGQEATHRRIHGLFNEHLERQGLTNEWAGRALQRAAVLDGADPRHALAITAATEHFTAILAEYLLQNHDLLDGAETRLKTMWMWHSAEESEHRSTAFDLYQALSGDHAWRRRWFLRITLIFLSDLARQTLRNLRDDRHLWKWQTWRSAAKHLFGRRGVVRKNIGPWRAYLRDDFHPCRQDDSLSKQWLAEHASQFRVLGTPAAAS